MEDISPLMLGLHALGAVIWVGGMFFAYVVLRPSVPGIEPPPERLKLWNRVFARFFRWVWHAIPVLLITGYWQVFIDFGGFESTGLHIHLMHGTGLVMVALFVFMYFKPYAAFRNAVANETWDVARGELERIRLIVGINLLIGLVTVVIGTTGRLWMIT